MLLSVVQSCMALSVEPFAYLRNVLERCEHPSGEPNRRIAARRLEASQRPATVDRRGSGRGPSVTSRFMFVQLPCQGRQFDWRTAVAVCAGSVTTCAGSTGEVCTPPDGYAGCVVRSLKTLLV